MELTKKKTRRASGEYKRFPNHLGKVTIPAQIRANYHITTQTIIEFVECEEGILLQIINPGDRPKPPLVGVKKTEKKETIKMTPKKKKYRKNYLTSDNSKCCLCGYSKELTIIDGYAYCNTCKGRL